MKKYNSLEIIRAKHYGQDLIDSLEKVFPEGVRRSGRSFEFKLESGHPAIEQVVRVLEAAGLRRWDGQDPYARRDPIVYELIETVQYEDADFRQMELLSMGTYPHDVSELAKDGSGRSMLQLDFFEHTGHEYDILAPYGNLLVVSTRLKNMIETWGLVGPVFKEAILCDGTGDDLGEPIPWSRYDGEPWWDMNSTVEMPPTAPGTEWRSLPTCRYPADYRKPREDRGPVQLISTPGNKGTAYLRSEINAMPPFDVAKGYEWWNFEGTKRTTIVSQRFYRLMHEAKIKGLRYGPVIIQDD